MNLFELSAKISVDDTNFKKSMENAQKVSKNVVTAIKNLQSPLDKAKSGFNAIAHPVETAKANIEKLKNATEAIRHPIETLKNKVADASTALETKRNKLSALAAGYDAAKKKVDDLTKEFNKSAKESGTSSKKTQELAKKLNEAEKEAEEAKKELDDYSKSVSKAGKESDSASKGVGNFASKLGKGLATAGKVAGAALGVAAAGISALTVAAINSFAEYEQLAGGAQKIFDQMDYSKIATDANNAYKELGLSANQYLAVINDVGATFAATMGDEAGYEAAKTGLKAISDYASGTGKNVDELSQKFTLITRSTSSYQSIADQFSGILPATSSAFLEQAQAAGILSDSYTQLTEVPIDEYQAAVSQMLQQGVKDLGLANNTMNEAFSTLSGSLSMAKGAWSNLVTGIADENANLDVLLTNFVESVGAVAENLIPKIEVALGSIASLIEKLAPVIVEALPSLVSSVVPSLISAATGMVNSVISVLPNLINTVVSAIIDNAPVLIDSAIVLVGELTNGILSQLPKIIQLGLDLTISIAKGIAESLPSIVAAMRDVIIQLAEVLTDPDTLGQMIEAAIAIMESLGESFLNPDSNNKMIEAAIGIVRNLSTFLMDNLEPLLTAAINLIMSLVDYLLNPDNIQKLVSAAIEIVVTIAGALVGAAGELLAAIGELVIQMIDKFKETDWSEIGSNLVEGFKQGIANAWDNLKEWFTGLFDDLISIAKEILGIESPSKVFKRLGKWTAEGFGIGWDDEFANVAKDIEDSLNFGGYDYEVVYDGNGISDPMISGLAGGGVTIVQNIYSEAKTAADLMQEALYQQERAVYLGV